MFSYQICEIFKSTYFEEYLPADASTNETHALLRKKKRIICIKPIARTMSALRNLQLFSNM